MTSNGTSELTSITESRKDAIQELEMERFIANQVNESLETIEDMCFVLKQSIEQSKGQLNFTLETDRAPNRSIKCRNCDNDKIEKFIISNREGNLTCTVCGTYITNQHDDSESRI